MKLNTIMLAAVLATAGATNDSHAFSFGNMFGAMIEKIKSNAEQVKNCALLNITLSTIMALLCTYRIEDKTGEIKINSLPRVTTGFGLLCLPLLTVISGGLMMGSIGEGNDFTNYITVDAPRIFWSLIPSAFIGVGLLMSSLASK